MSLSVLHFLYKLCKEHKLYKPNEEGRIYYSTLKCIIKGKFNIRKL